MPGKPHGRMGEDQPVALPAATRLWTVQPLEVWEQLQLYGFVHVDETWLGAPSDVPGAYRWLVPQLEQRLPGYPGTLPWWAYCEKPDLRWVRHRRPAGRPQVRLELEPPPRTFLTFPSWAWDEVYCGRYLSFARAEHDEWTEAMRQAVPDEDARPLPEPWQAQLESSWLLLFDPDLPPKAWDHEDLCFVRRSASREVVLGLLRLEDMRHVTQFVGCDKWR